MKKILLAAILIPALILTALATFPTRTHTVKLKLGQPNPWSDFSWKWYGYEDQAVSITFDTTLATYTCGFKLSRTNACFINTTNITVTTSNLTWTVSRTNVPPNGLYEAELWAYEGASTNTARTLAQGKVQVLRSLYQEGDSTFPWPAKTNDLSQYLLISRANTDFASKSLNATNAAVDGNVLTATVSGGATNHYWSSAGAGDITAVTVSGGLLSGGAASGPADIALTTSTVQSAAQTAFLQAQIGSNDTDIASNLTTIQEVQNATNGYALGATAGHAGTNYMATNTLTTLVKDIRDNTNGYALGATAGFAATNTWATNVLTTWLEDVRGQTQRYEQAAVDGIYATNMGLQEVYENGDRIDWKYGVDLDGSTEYFSDTNTVLLQNATGITISAWIKLNTLTAGD